MGRKRREKLPGLVELGRRLRELRQKAGLSQMKLAQGMGFVPTHGYKYIFRLEKGLVPNPTIRTLMYYLHACGAGWQDIIELLPGSSVPGRPAREPEPPKTPAPPVPAPEPAPSRPRDSRPQRLRLRAELQARRKEHAQAFWTRFELVEQRAAELLHHRGVPSSQQRQYFAFVRSCCSAIDAYRSARPAQLNQELGRAVNRAKESGLNENVIAALRNVCLESLGVSTGGRS